MELSQEAKLMIFQSVYHHSHWFWVVTERMRLQIQVAKVSFLNRVAGLSLRDRVRGFASKGGS